MYADFEEPYKLVPPHEAALISTGINFSCSLEYCFTLKERSSTVIKGIAQRSGVIDSGYRGEWMIPITKFKGNISSTCILFAIAKYAIDFEAKFRQIRKLNAALLTQGKED